MIQYITRRLLALPLMIFLVTAVIFLLGPTAPRRAKSRRVSPQRQARKNRSRRTAGHGDHHREIWPGSAPPHPIHPLAAASSLPGRLGLFTHLAAAGTLEGLRERVPANLELTFFAMIPAIFFALVLGELGGNTKAVFPIISSGAPPSSGGPSPAFILGLILMNVLYAWLGWFPPERLSSWAGPIVTAENLHTYTGLYTVDALLNGNFELCVDALRHLVLPGITLAAVQWALLTRIMRNRTGSPARRLHHDRPGQGSTWAQNSQRPRPPRQHPSRHLHHRRGHVTFPQQHRRDRSPVQLQRCRALGRQSHPKRRYTGGDRLRTL